MEFSKRNLIIVGGIILVLILGIVVINKQSLKKDKANQGYPVRDFNEVKENEKITITPTPTTIPTRVVLPTVVPTKIITPTPSPTSIPSNTPTLTKKPTIISTKTPTPTIDTSIYATGVSLSLTELNLQVGSTYQVLYRVEPNNTTDKTVTWSSDNGNVAIVDSSGKITAKSIGNAVVTARTSNNKTTIINVTVSNIDNQSPSNSQLPTPTPTVMDYIYPTKIFLNYSTVEVKIGEYVQLRANIEPINVSNFLVKWSSSDASVAVVDIKGRVTAKSAGNLTVTGKTINGLEAVANIIIVDTQTSSPTNAVTSSPTNAPTNAPTNTPTNTPTPQNILPEKLTLSPSVVSLNSGNKYEMYTKVEPTNASNKSLIWSSSNSKVATVNTKGVITAISSGKSTITAKTSNGIKATSTVNVLVTVTPTKTPVATTAGKISHLSYDGMQYVFYLPGEYSTSYKWPLLVYLHGWGEHGTDINLLYNNGAIPQLLKNGNDFNAIIVSPQNSGSWSSTSKQNAVISLINHITKNYKVDKAKISLTGNSDACWGIWPMVRNNPTLFSAVVPMSSSNPTSNSSSGLTSTKIWYFYGTRDVSTTNRSNLIFAINQAGGDAKITAINGSHNINKVVYLDNKMIEWMITQTR